MHSSLDAILRSLELAPAILEEFVRTIPAEALGSVRRPGFWTIERHVYHLAEVQPMLYGRLLRFRDEESPSFVPYLPGSGAAPPPEVTVTSIDNALELFRLWRMKSLDLAGSQTDSYWTKTGSHPEYTAYTAFGLLRHIMMHDHWHMYRMEELWLTRDEFLTELQ